MLAMSGALGVVSPEIRASGQYEVDPAELIDPSSVVLEVWHGRLQSGGERRSFASVATRGQGAWMLVIEAGRERIDAGTRANVAAAEAILALDDQSGPAMLSVFAGLEYSSEQDRLERGELRLLTTINAGDGLALHLNAGVARERRASSPSVVVWGSAAEAALYGPFEGVIELVGDGRGGRPRGKLGLRWALPRSRDVVVDLTWSADFESGGEREWILGFGIPVGR